MVQTVIKFSLEPKDVMARLNTNKLKLLESAWSPDKEGIQQEKFVNMILGTVHVPEG